MGQLMICLTTDLNLTLMFLKEVKCMHPCEGNFYCSERMNEWMNFDLLRLSTPHVSMFHSCVWTWLSRGRPCVNDACKLVCQQACRSHLSVSLDSNCKERNSKLFVCVCWLSLVFKFFNHHHETHNGASFFRMRSEKKELRCLHATWELGSPLSLVGCLFCNLRMKKLHIQFSKRERDNQNCLILLSTPALSVKSVESASEHHRHVIINSLANGVCGNLFKWV